MCQIFLTHFVQFQTSFRYFHNFDKIAEECDLLNSIRCCFLFLVLSLRRFKRLKKGQTQQIFFLINCDAIPEKIDRTKKINQKWKELKNFDNYFSVIFSCYDQSLVSGRKTGQYILVFPTNFEVLFDIFKIPKILRYTFFGNS